MMKEGLGWQEVAFAPERYSRSPLPTEHRAAATRYAAGPRRQPGDPLRPCRPYVHSGIKTTAWARVPAGQVVGEECAIKDLNLTWHENAGRAGLGPKQSQVAAQPLQQTLMRGHDHLLIPRRRTCPVMSGAPDTCGAAEQQQSVIPSGNVRCRPARPTISDTVGPQWHHPMIERRRR